MYRLFFSFCLLLSYNINASIDNYLKRIPHDDLNHSMRNIDYIYMINLDKRPEKFAKSAGQLKNYGIYPFRFSAINAWEDLTPSIVNDVGVVLAPGMKTGFLGTSYLDAQNDFYLRPKHEKINVLGRTYFCHCMGIGPIAIVLSHLSVLQDAWDSGFQTVWIMEDDVEVIRNPHILCDYINELDHVVGSNNWDILFTDIDTKSNKGGRVPCYGYALRPNFSPSNPERFQQRVSITNNLKKIGARYGAYSMIVRRSGMQKLLNFIKRHKIFLPYDMDFTLPNDIQLYSVTDDVVSTQVLAPSDNGAPNYRNKK